MSIEARELETVIGLLPDCGHPTSRGVCPGCIAAAVLAALDAVRRKAGDERAEEIAQAIGAKREDAWKSFLSARGAASQAFWQGTFDTLTDAARIARESR